MMDFLNKRLTIINEFLRSQRTYKRRLIKLDKKRLVILNQIIFNKKVEEHVKSGMGEMQATFTAAYGEHVKNLFEERNFLFNKIKKSQFNMGASFIVPLSKDKL